MRQADWGLRTVPPPTVPTSNDGIVQLNKVKKTGITTGKQIKSGINCFQAKVMKNYMTWDLSVIMYTNPNSRVFFLCNFHKTLIKQKDSTSTQTGNVNMWKKLSYLMYRSSLFGPHGSSNVIQLLLETHCAGS